MEDTSFTPDRSAYVRAHAWMAAVGMGGAMALLWALNSPHVWTGAVGGLAAIGLRGWYMASEEMAVVWTLTKETLTGPVGRSVQVSQIETVKTMGSYVQVITKSGDKHLIKYQANPSATAMTIERAAT
ncbi:hypothetical protein AB838_19720 [Rhodobacteraceae bacterium (ex Bugula neritina AB1)]|nr:hypothetical protein AB838_19720 [Rhodobacteraceae bacterium (ex Bugula neritina AB1)]